ncbi:MAG: hypothetical protein LBV67_01520 [Streptococcaceae bacterium]|nr:hypothetical protein [Streptococcaceae bacterium]
MSEDKKVDSQDVQLDDLKDMTIGSVQEMFDEETSEDKIEKAEKIDETAQKSLIDRLQEKVDVQLNQPTDNDSHILSQYIKAHKKGYKGPAWEEGVGLAILTGEVKNLAEVEGIDEEELDKNIEEAKQATKVIEKVKELPIEEPKTQEATQKLMEEKPEVKNLSKDLDEKTALDQFLPKEPEKVQTNFENIVSNDEEIRTRATNKNSSYKKTIIIALCVLALGGVGYAGFQAYTSHQTRQTAMQLARDNASLQDLQTKIASFYTDDTHNFIKTDRLGEITGIGTQLKDLKHATDFDKVNAQFQDLETKANLIKNVNGLFKYNAIRNDQLTDNLILAKYQAVNVSVDSSSTPLNDLANKAITEAKAQYDTMKVADEKVSALERQVDKANQADLDSARELIKAIKNEEIRSSFTSRLSAYAKAVEGETTNANTNADTGGATLPNQGGDAQANSGVGSDAGVNVGAGAGTGTNAGAGTNSSSPTYVGNSPNPDGIGINWFEPTFPTVNNQNQAGPQNASVARVSVVPLNQAAINNHTDPRWSWTPGVQQTVIRKLIGRGNIGWSGWFLNPANIINGNPYYNLISPDGNYVVTINARTGWFKGGGSDSIIGLDFDPATAIFG